MPISSSPAGRVGPPSRNRSIVDDRRFGSRRASANERDDRRAERSEHEARASRPRRSTGGGGEHETGPPSSSPAEAGSAAGLAGDEHLAPEPTRASRGGARAPTTSRKP